MEEMWESKWRHRRTSRRWLINYTFNHMLLAKTSDRVNLVSYDRVAMQRYGCRKIGNGVNKSICNTVLFSCAHR